MTLEEWQKNRKLVAWAKAIFESENWGVAEKVMESQHVRHYKQDCEGVQKLGRIEGWDLCVARLGQLAVFTQKIEELPPPSFQPEDKPRK